jgi:hypothetical protein
VAKQPASTPPGDQSSGPPRDLYAVADIRFVIGELGKLSAQVERLITDVGKNGEKLDEVRHQISFAKGVASVVGSLLVIFGAVAVWYFKDKIGAK